MTAVKLEERVRNLNDIEIVLVDRNDYHQYLHLAYEIVTGVKKVSDLTIPLAELLERRKIRFFQANVNKIDLDNKLVITDKGDLPYDELVIALGSEPGYRGIEGVKEHSFSVDSVEAAAKIKDRLKTMDKEKQPNIVVGGGGFTGVELAGEIADEFNCCVTILEGSEILVPSWNKPEFSRKVAAVLTDMGVKLVLGKLISEVKLGAIIFDDGSQIGYDLFIWAGGVRGSYVVSESGLRTEKGNRVLINEFCEALGFPGVYMVGDCALVVDPKTGTVLPQCVEIALQQAEVVAQNLYADVTQRERTA
jgi:NADH dehydrogenase